MRKALLPLALVFAAVFTSACSSTHIHEFQQHPDVVAGDYESFVVHCSAEDETQRAIIEAEVADRLIAAGYDAEASFRRDDGKSTAPFRVAASPNYDALIWIGFGSYDTEIREFPGQVTHHSGFNTGFGFGGRGYGYGHHGFGRRGFGFSGFNFGTSYTPPRTEVSQSLLTRIELIDAAKDEKIWSAKAASRTRSDQGLERLAESLGREVVSLVRQTTD